MPVIIASGIATSIISSEVTLYSEIANRNYILAINTSGMKSGDSTFLRLYTTVVSGMGLQLADQDTISGTQSVPIKFTDPITSPSSISARIFQHMGTARNYPWELIAI